MPSASFLSYSHAEKVAADALHGELARAGIDLFQDATHLRSGDRWLQRLQQAIADCGGFIVLIGRDGVQRWVAGEVEAALNRHFSARGDAPRLPIHPLLLPGATADNLPPFLALFQAETWEPGAPLPTGLVEALRQGQLRLDSQARFEGCPYLGLASFGAADAKLFFGRRSETLAALASLGDPRDTDPGQASAGGAGHVRWLQVEGHSGSGKSSLVRAGLLPMLPHGALWPRTRLAQWRLLGPMVPGHDPVAGLAAALEHGLRPDPQQRDTMARLQGLQRGPAALAMALLDHKTPDTGFLLVIDQFEELFTLAGAAQRERFDALLAHALQDELCPLYLVSTVRSDFLDRMDELPALSGLLNRLCKRQLLPGISQEGLREVIEGPAQLAGLDVAEVSTAMLREAQGEPGALPLVENALTQLWHQRSQGRLSGTLFGELGGLAGMLSASADALLQRIEADAPGHGRAGALELLLLLTRVNTDDALRHSRQRLTRDEAVLAAGDGDATRGARVLQQLSGQRPDGQPADAPLGHLRLVTVSAEGDGSAAGGPVYVNLIHETLVRARAATTPGAKPSPYWSTLYAHIEANRDRMLWRQQIGLEFERQFKRWQAASPRERWRRCASRRQLHDYRRERLGRERLGREAGERQFLSQSQRWHRLQGAALALLALPVLVSGLVWQWKAVRHLAAQVGNTAFYLIAIPFWSAGDRWLPVPEVVELPALPEGQTFAMGCVKGRDDVREGLKGVCDDSPTPRDTPMPHPCAIGRYEVTNLEYNRFVWETGGKGIAALWDYPADGIFGTYGRPVVKVSWDDAQKYLVWLSAKTHQKWQLPSEAEWEYAARGSSGGPYPWGNTSPAGKANCADCGDTYSGSRTAPVGSYPAYGFGAGLHDMSGNVWEWVDDKLNPADASSNASRVLRGGSWAYDTGDLRAADRFGVSPGARGGSIGFRVCRSSPIEKPITGALDAGPLAR